MIPPQGNVQGVSSLNEDLAWLDAYQQRASFGQQGEPTESAWQRLKIADGWRCVKVAEVTVSDIGNNERNA